MTIRLKFYSKEGGGPKNIKAKVVADEKVDRKWLEAMEEIAGEAKLQGLLNALESKQPTPADTQRRLSWVMVKYADAELKKTNF